MPSSKTWFRTTFSSMSLERTLAPSLMHSMYAPASLRCNVYTSSGGGLRTNNVASEIIEKECVSQLSSFPTIDRSFQFLSTLYLRKTMLQKYGCMLAHASADFRSSKVKGLVRPKWLADCKATHLVGV
jgi:hypothetical protein